MVQHRHRHPSLWTPRRVPLGRVEIDPNHPLSRGLIISVLPTQPFVNLAPAPGTGPTVHDTGAFTVGVRAGIAGPGYFSTAAITALARTYFTLTGKYGAAPDYSVFSYQQLPVAGQGTSGYAAFDGDGGYNQLARIWQNRIVNNQTVFIAFDTSQNPYFAYGPTLSATQQAAGWTQSGRSSDAEKKIYLTVNGAAGGTAAISNTLAGYNNWSPYPPAFAFCSSVNPYAQNNPLTFLGQAFVGHVWARKLSDAEDAWVHAEPFAMYRPVARKVWRSQAVAPPASRNGPMISMIH